MSTLDELKKLVDRVARARLELIAARDAVTPVIVGMSRQIDQLDEIIAGLETGPPPGPMVSGPQFSDKIGARLTRQSYHKAMGVPQKHGMFGADNLSVVDRFTMGHHTIGAGASIVDDRSMAWHDLPATDTLAMSFNVRFVETDGKPFDFGWQSKFGWGLGGYHSGEVWPGGNVCHPPDWLIRPVWNHYQRRGRRRFGVYIYSRDELAHIDGWGTPVKGGGYRRLALFDNAPTPVSGQPYNIELRVSKATAATHQLQAFVDGARQLDTPIDLGAPCNWLVMSNGYGGSGPEEGPNHPTTYHLSGLKLVRD